MGWLFEAKKRYGLSVVNDTVTSNQLQQAGNRISLVSIHHQKVNVIAGGTGWLNTDIYSTVRRLGLETQVHFIGYVEENDLPVVYSLAAVFVYPSLYEGFGLPVLEAMQCGVPVLTSNVSSLPEVAGDAALLVTPTEVDDIAYGLKRILEDADLRAELRARGYQRAREFSWERCARETLAVYKDVYDRS